MKEKVPNVFAVSYTIKTMLITWLEMIGFIAVMHYSVSIMNIRKRGHKKNRKVVGLEKLVFYPHKYNCHFGSILVECIHNEKNDTSKSIYEKYKH